MTPQTLTHYPKRSKVDELKEQSMKLHRLVFNLDMVLFQEHVYRELYNDYDKSRIYAHQADRLEKLINRLVKEVRV